MQVLESAVTICYCVKTHRNYDFVTNILYMPVCKIRSIVCSCNNCLPYAKQRNSFLRYGSKQGETRKNQITKEFITNAEDLSQPVPVLNKDLVAVFL
jgi:hypothetical protein